MVLLARDIASTMHPFRKLCLVILTFSYKIIFLFFWKSDDAVKPPSKSDRRVQFNYINAVSSSALALSQLSNTCITESYKQMIYFHSDSLMCTHVTCRGRLFHVIQLITQQYQFKKLTHWFHVSCWSPNSINAQESASISFISLELLKSHLSECQELSVRDRRRLHLHPLTNASIWKNPPWIHMKCTCLLPGNSLDEQGIP